MKKILVHFSSRGHGTGSRLILKRQQPGSGSQV